MTKHILVVDDEPRVAFFLSKALEHNGQDYRVSVAHSGEEALEVLSQSPVDLLVTDLRLPGISGLELMRWVRASSPQTRTILITAYGNDEVEAETRRLQAYRYITKPFSLDDFTRIAEEALREAATGQPGLLVLSDETFEVISQQLERLRQDVGARCVILADMLGQRLAEVGVTEGINTPALLSLLAGGFAASGELGRQFGDGSALNLHFHESSRYEIYSANVGENLFLAMVYDRKVQTSRIGIVWLYTRRAIERLQATMSVAPPQTPAQSLDTDFAPSLMAELDTIFAAPAQRPSQEQHTPPQQPLEAIPATPPPPPSPSDALDRLGLGVPLANGKKRELLSMEDAIAQGIIPPHLGNTKHTNR